MNVVETTGKPYLLLKKGLWVLIALTVDPGEFDVKLLIGRELAGACYKWAFLPGGILTT